MAAVDSESEDETEISFKGRRLAKIEKKEWNNYVGKNIQSIILDNNDLTKLENLGVFSDTLTSLSASYNHLPRMYGVASLHRLTSLNLSNNFLVCIEALKEIPNLRWLNLAKNNIKLIQNLAYSTKIEHLDLSENRISSLSDISSLSNLHTLLLHGNKISSLRYISKYFPQTVRILSLASNEIIDLNEICNLVGLCNLTQFSIMSNPCVSMTNKEVGFDYRPFIINWCFTLEYLDGYAIGDKESLKAEWLYCQGKGRHFSLGQYDELIKYLSSCCPLTSDMLESEDDVRLSRVLRKQKQHKKQLLEERSSSSVMTTSTPSLSEFSDMWQSKDSKMSISIGPYCPEVQKSLKEDRLWSPVKLACNYGSNDANDVKIEDLSENEMTRSLDYNPSLIPSTCVRSSKRPRSISSCDVPVKYSSNSSKMVCKPETNPLPVKAAQVRKISPKPSSAESKSKLPNYMKTLNQNIPLNSTYNLKNLSNIRSKFKATEYNKEIVDKTYSPEKSTQIKSLTMRKQQETKRSNKILNIGLNPSKSSNIGAKSNKTGSEKIPSHHVNSNISKKNYSAEKVKSIIKIQALWRGKWIRNFCPKTTRIIQNLCMQRMQRRMEFLNENVKKLSEQMAHEREQRELQERLVSSLWNELKAINERLDQCSCKCQCKSNPDTQDVSNDVKSSENLQEKSKADGLIEENESDRKSENYIASECNSSLKDEENHNTSSCETRNVVEDENKE